MEADRQIQDQYGIYDHPRLEEYVNEVGRKVLEVSHMRREEADPKYRETDFHFRILDSPVVNAFALPGGYVYVTRGLMAHLQNEAQLAVVLGHEIGHVAARHASQRALEQQLGQIALLGGAIAGQELLGVPGGNILDLGSQSGLETYHAEASATENGTVYRFSLTAVAYGEEIYRFISYSREEEYPEYRSRFREIAGSFRELEDSEALSIQPLRLNVAPVRRTALLSELLSEPLPENTSVEDIAILNQVEQDQAMEEGRLLKVPVRE